MIDVTDKEITKREAIASGQVSMKPETLRLISSGQMPKGDVLSVARVAGIMAAKKTSDLIPMCHPLEITDVMLDFDLDEKDSRVRITSRVRSVGRTGVEMEALVAVTSAALTVYDMSKTVDRGMVISNIRLLRKSGGKSGTYNAEFSNSQF
jgi:cyclic pyranopterin phosphate synthase